MCGICGYIGKENIGVQRLQVMNDTMIHRGPDDAGTELYDLGKGYTLGFAQRRLSILDLSPLGHQPMHSPCGRVSIVYNGEIYNFQEIRKQLPEYSFLSQCDTEVILAAYLKWGIRAVDKFNGMFAIALYDRQEEALYLVRDRIGKKPLYYYLKDQTMVFASELKPIMSYPDYPRVIRKDVIPGYLARLYIPAPDTIFEDTYKLPPGGILRVSLGKEVLTGQVSKYWDIADAYQSAKANRITDFAEAKEELKDLLLAATKRRMIADVPLGTFLSGGYDSSLISAMAQSVSEQPVKTFCIGFEEAQYNEAGYARAVAKHLGTDHTELMIGEKDMLALVREIAQYYDEPMADSSQIPTMLVSSLARSKVTVALSGDGGDEFFCGYNIYPAMKQAQRLDALGGMTYAVANLPGLKQLGVLGHLPYRVRTIASNRSKETKTQFGGEIYEQQIQNMLPDVKVAVKFAAESHYGEKNWQIRRMLLDMDTYLPGDILCKVDRASMKYSLETRCPILDPEVMEYSFRLDHSIKYSQGIGKRVLREIAYDYIPKELLERPKKGFGVPLDLWLRGPLSEQLYSYSRKEYLDAQGIFAGAYTQSFMDQYLANGDAGPATGRNFSKTAWAFFVFQQWYETYMGDNRRL